MECKSWHPQTKRSLVMGKAEAAAQYLEGWPKDNLRNKKYIMS